MKSVCGVQPGSCKKPELHVVRRKIREPEVPPETRFVAVDAKATTAPRAAADGVMLSPPVTSFPCASTETAIVALAPQGGAPPAVAGKIGRASCRERG